MWEQCGRVYADVSLDAIRNNVKHMKAVIAPETKIMAVIKADGYGHGAIPIAQELEQLSYLAGFAVATAEEALLLREAGIAKPILILGYTFPDSYESLICREVRFTVFRKDTLSELSKAVKNLESQGIHSKAKVHIKIDTGMSRIGVRTDEEGFSFVRQAFATEQIEVEGIFTHFARADETDKRDAYRQLAQFRQFVERAEEMTGRVIPVKHCSNSAGIIEIPEANLTMVRAGITLYGLWPSAGVRKDVVPLMPALSLYSHIVYVKEIEKGCHVSYGGTYEADCVRKVATIPVGYGDGYPRSLSNKGYVLIRGRRAPILGRVCMDQFMVDVTEIEGVEEGDLVTLIGKDGGEEITMELLGELSGRFNYEFACDLGKRIPRVYTKDGKILNTFRQYGYTT